MKYLVTGVFAVALLASPAALAAHHWNHGWNNGPHHHGWQNNHRWRAHQRFGNWRNYSWFDWRMHHLHDPGRYHWVFVDGQYLLLDDRGFIVEIGGE